MSGHCEHCAPSCTGIDSSVGRAHHAEVTFEFNNGQKLPRWVSEWDDGFCPACAERYKLEETYDDGYMVPGTPIRQLIRHPIETETRGDA